MKEEKLIINSNKLSQEIIHYNTKHFIQASETSFSNVLFSEKVPPPETNNSTSKYILVEDLSVFAQNK